MKSEHQTATDVTGANKAIAIGLLEAIVAGDISRIESLIDPAANWWVQGWGALDRTSFVASLLRTIARSSERKMDILYATAEEDRVAIAAEGEFLFPEGAYCNSYHFLFTVANGRVIGGREYMDTKIASRFFAA
jgi:ketosteroid isomerase-like protein